MSGWHVGNLANPLPSGLEVVKVSRVEVFVLEQSRATGAADVAMEQYARGDDAAFDALYDALADRLYRFIRRHMRDAHRCDDVLQETFLRIHRARGSFAPGAPVLPWAFAIARRLVADEGRRDRRAPLVLDDEEPLLTSPAPVGDGPEQRAEARQFAERFARALGGLPESQRTAFGLLKQDGLTVAEAAAVLGVTVTAVKLRAHRAYGALRRVFGDRLRDVPEETR